MDNVNNLNGVPNFGHGFNTPMAEAEGIPEIGTPMTEEESEEATPAEAPEEEVEISKTEETE